MVCLGVKTKQNKTHLRFWPQRVRIIWGLLQAAQKIVSHLGMMASTQDSFFFFFNVILCAAPSFFGEEYWYCSTWLEFERVHQVVLDTLQEKCEDGWNCTCIYTQRMKNMSVYDHHCSMELFFFLLLSFLYLSRTSERCNVSLCGDGISVPVDLQYHTYTTQAYHAWVVRSTSD